MSERFYTVEQGSSAYAVAGMLRVLFPDAATVLDMTHGNGSFWRGTVADVAVTGLDIDPRRAKDAAADFTALPFVDESFDLAVFDPPFHADMGRGKASITGKRYTAYATMADLREAVEDGCREAFRVARIGVLVKCQDYIHGSRFVEMTQWVRDAIGQPPYQRLDLMRPHKLMDPKWTEQLSLYSNSATFLAFRHGDQRHIRRRRRPLASGVA